MENRKAIWYSIVRYSPNDISGEIVNVGLIMHNVDGDDNLKYFILDENSYKLRSISNTNVDINTYKSYREMLEYYLNKCNNDLAGMVGAFSIGSSYEPEFLDKIYNYYLNTKLTITKPNFAFTDNVNMLFNSLFRTYVGEQYLMDEPKTVNAKKYIKEIFEERKLIGRKIKADLEFIPIEGLDDLKVKVDFGFKNGVWNYMQAIPALRAPSEISEWFAKTKFTIETLRSKDETSRVHLMYKVSDVKENVTSMIDYLVEENQEVDRLNVEDNSIINDFCNYIEDNAEDMEEFIAS